MVASLGAPGNKLIAAGGWDLQNLCTVLHLHAIFRTVRPIAIRLSGAFNPDGPTRRHRQLEVGTAKAAVQPAAPDDVAGIGLQELAIWAGVLSTRLLLAAGAVVIALDALRVGLQLQGPWLRRQEKVGFPANVWGELFEVGCTLRELLRLD